MARGFSEKEKIIIGEKLISSGQELFGRYGFEKTSLDQIVNMTGIAKGSFYKFYPNKELFFLDCLASTELQMDREVITPLINNSRSAGELLNDLFDIALHAAERYPIIQSWFETSSKERILASLPEAYQKKMDGTDEKRMISLVKRLEELAPGFSFSSKDLASLYRAFFFLNEHRNMISDEYEVFMKKFGKIMIKGLIDDQG